MNIRKRLTIQTEPPANGGFQQPKTMSNKNEATTPVGSGAGLGVVSTIFNLGIPLASWYATHGNAGAGNVVKLMAALTVILTPFVFLSFLSPGKPVPRWREWSSHISDGATVAILTWNGWMWCALAFTFGWIGAAILFGVKRAATTPNGGR